MKKTFLTKEGFKKLEKELNELKNTKRSACVKKLQTARSMGDLSENSAYTTARQELRFIDRRIGEIERIIKSAKIVENTTSPSYVSIGATVSVIINFQTKDFQIVGEFEADPLNNKISHISPIGRSLLGKKVGEEVKIHIPAGITVYKILSIK